MATYSKSVLDALTENPAQLFVDFLKFLQSTQPITVTSSAPTITIPCVQPSAVESTQPITATFTCSTNVPSTSAICVPGVQPSAGWIRLGRKRGVWRGTCPVPYVNLYTTCICCKVQIFITM
ncbi:uncharacterized protein LOC136088456 [Hydra vulgaris]|uniref:uncharacterized protein LOC136088456 n=1 Tax=Hydra vulgaris TaxID=6087 RepID=UPI0032EA8EF6